jgi:transcriptional regulator with PAS, ATPase and Fis domain
MPDFLKDFPGALTVCDVNGTIIYMNEASIEVFKDDGGAGLIGTSVLDCHPEPSRSKLCEMMEKHETNIYTIQKHGKKKLIYQTAWYQDGEYAGFIELALYIPWEMPHFNRDKAE